jgi:hypothetical protein
MRPSATGIELLGDPGGLVVLLDDPVVSVLRHDALDFGEEMRDARSDPSGGLKPSRCARRFVAAPGFGSPLGPCTGAVVAG